MVISLLLPKQYTANTSVVVDVKSPDPIAGMVLPGLASPAYMATQIDIINSEVENAGSKTATGAGAELIKFSVKAPLVNPGGAKADDKSAAGKKAKKASKAAR